MDDYGTTLNWTDMTPAARAGQLGTLSADNPSWTDRLAGAFSNAMGYFGATPQGQRNAYQFAQTGAPIIPGIGQALSANEAYRGVQQGNYPQAVLGALGAIPIPGAGGGILSKEGEAIYHGSPNLFKRFSFGRAESSEQGFGTYLSTNPEYAKDYAGNQGYLYKVQMPHDPSTFFDWDAPFKDQPQNVKDAITKGFGYTPDDSDIGQKIHGDLQDNYFESEISRMFAENGVPGTKYSSRGGVDNYVMHDTRGLKILGSEPVLLGRE